MLPNNRHLLIGFAEQFTGADPKSRAAQFKRYAHKKESPHGGEN